MWRPIFRCLMVLAGLCPALASAQTAMPEVKASILASSDAPRPGQQLEIGITIDPGPGWHIYWQNPGETGYPPRFVWSLPAGFAVTTLQPPAPVRLIVAGSKANVLLGRTVMLARLSVPRSAQIGAAVPISGSVDLLVCSDSMCVPQLVKLSRMLTVGTGSPNNVEQPRLAATRRQLPVVLAQPAAFRWHSGKLILRADLPGMRPGEVVSAFFPGADHGDFGQAEQSPGAIGQFVIEKGTFQLTNMGLLPVVLTFGRPGEPPRASYSVQALPEAPTDLARSVSLTALLAVGGALAGGLLLNLMPCVFPVLSLKAISLVRSGSDEHAARTDALGYFAGAVGIMVSLGVAVLSLRAGGAAVGWAFQLQDTRVIAVLLTVVAALATNMAGLFELPALPVTLSKRSGFAGGLGSGALAAFIATPCTGPFMAGALGAALLLPSILAILVFAALGTGLALPFLLLAFVPRFRRLIPKPGLWMVHLRRLLSIPMFATALWLAWLLGRQSDVNTMAGGLTATVAVVLALWWAGLRQRAGKRSLPAGALAAVFLMMAPWLTASAPAATTHAKAVLARDEVAYSPKALAGLRRDHRPFLLYATADWCLTCKVNEATSLGAPSVRASLARAGAVVMVADWTRNDPQITKLLADFGRAGVPLYIWFPAHGKPLILPQVLTPATVSDVIGQSA